VRSGTQFPIVQEVVHVAFVGCPRSLPEEVGANKNGGNKKCYSDNEYSNRYLSRAILPMTVCSYAVYESSVLCDYRYVGLCTRQLTVISSYHQNDTILASSNKEGDYTSY
jgi:hypothetical protein